MNTTPKRALVIGGGVAGLKAAWDLSQSGVHVDLIEKSNFLGGHAIRYCCKADGECRRCGACTAEKVLKDVMAESRITVHLGTQVETVENARGFRVGLLKTPRLIDPVKCTGCGDCFRKLAVTGVVQKGFSKNNFPLYAIDAEKLLQYREELVGVCPENAIDLDQNATREEIAADAVVVATGFQAFDPRRKPTYGYGVFPNLVTGLELETIIRDRGAVVRPSDGAKPARIAFIQCVGSRDERLGNLWCSQVCCPYALRMASLIKHQDTEAEVTVFYMDIQNAGNDFPRFYDELQKEVRFIRTIPVDVYPLEGDRLEMRFAAEDDGQPVKEPFDLVVLSVGIMPGPDNARLGELLSLTSDRDGFLTGNGKAMAEEGVFLAGTVEGPKSISASMAHAGQAAREAMAYLGVIK